MDFPPFQQATGSVTQAALAAERSSVWDPHPIVTITVQPRAESCRAAGLPVRLRLCPPCRGIAWFDPLVCSMPAASSLKWLCNRILP